MSKKNVKKQDVKKEKKVTVVSVIKPLAIVGGTDREEIAKKAYNKLKERGITKNSKGFDIREEKVLSLLTAMCRDINNEKKGWWSNYKIEEDERHFKFVVKAQLKAQ